MHCLAIGVCGTVPTPRCRRSQEGSCPRLLCRFCALWASCVSIFWQLLEQIRVYQVGSGVRALLGSSFWSVSWHGGPWDSVSSVLRWTLDINFYFCTINLLVCILLEVVEKLCSGGTLISHLFYCTITCPLGNGSLLVLACQEVSYSSRTLGIYIDLLVSPPGFCHFRQNWVALGLESPQGCRHKGCFLIDSSGIADRHEDLDM